MEFSISLKEYYPWKKDVGVRYPWERQSLNSEFLKYEKKRIELLSEWHKKFEKIDVGGSLDEASFYVVPIELASSWKGAIANFGNFNYVGLSALCNSPQVPIMALLPSTAEQPQEYRLILIRKSKKINIVNKVLKSVESCVLIEKWEPLPSDHVYVDVPYEKKIVEKLIRENLIDDKQISLAFQTPIISAPYVHGAIGGISLSSIAGESAFAAELVKTVQLMVPPEYRSFPPPKKVAIGYDFEYFKGIKFHLAERPYFDNNFLSGVYSKNYDKLASELSRRLTFSGEYSIFSTLNPAYGNITQIWNELMKNFTNTEITLPQDLDELLEADVELTRLKNAINDDLWVQVVYSRQFRPSISKTDDDFVRIINRIKDDFDVLLADTVKKEISREHLVRSMLHPTRYNLMRIAQSLARADEKEELNTQHLERARNVIVDNFTGFIQHPQFKRIKLKMEKVKSNARFEVVQTELINNPRSSTGELYDSIKYTELFEDVYDIQRFLDWLHERGYVIEDVEKKYTWVGGFVT